MDIFSPKRSDVGRELAEADKEAGVERRVIEMLLIFNLIVDH